MTPPTRIDGVLFDFDGTLTEPGAIDFLAVREALGCPADRYLLEFIADLPAGEQRDAARSLLARHEEDGATRSRPMPGAEDLVLWLHELGVPAGLLTRNSRAAVERSLANFDRVTTADFDVVLTRDDPVAPKPAPDAVLLAAERMGVAPGRLLMVGDFVLDVQAGRAAGALTAYLETQTAAGDGAGQEPAPTAADYFDARPSPGECDFFAGSLDEVREIVALRRPLPQGKLPNDLLGRFLADVTGAGEGGQDGGVIGVGQGKGDRAVIVGAGVGEDVAVLDVAGADLVVVHGDPITLAGSGVGGAAVTINANDIAASGAVPRWFLATVLLPAGTTAAEALALLEEVADACAAQGIALVGGHTEVSAAVTRPVVSGTMLGVAGRAGLRAKRAVRRGDHVLMTKALAIEGTALLAVGRRAHLLATGVSAADLDAWAALAGRASIVAEARIAAAHEGVRAMHDVTEGGVATALDEVAVACGHALVVDLDAIPVLPETRRLCGLLDADPLGLIASGALLICCDPARSASLVAALAAAGIDATVIGVVGEPRADEEAVESGRSRHGAPAALVRATAGGRAAPWPRFARDEAARLLAGASGETGDRV